MPIPVHRVQRVPGASCGDLIARDDLRDPMLVARQGHARHVESTEPLHTETELDRCRPCGMSSSTLSLDEVVSGGS